MLKRTLDLSVDVINMRYVWVSDQYGNATFSSRRNRLVKTSKHFQWIGAVHEYLEVGGIVQNRKSLLRTRERTTRLTACVDL